MAVARAVTGANQSEGVGRAPETKRQRSLPQAPSRTVSGRVSDQGPAMRLSEQSVARPRRLSAGSAPPRSRNQMASAPAATSKACRPPVAGTSARLASGGSAPGGAMSVARSGAVLAMIVRPSGVHVGSAHQAGAVVRRTGASRPSARAFQRAPPDSSHVTNATQRLSGDQAGMNSRARALAVRRRGAPVTSAIQMRPSDEKATCPLGAVACCCTRRVRTGPVASRCGKCSVGVTSSETSAMNGITVSLPLCTPRRWILPP